MNTKAIFALLYLICVICGELLYRDSLFNKSLQIELDIQANLSDAGKGFFKFITNFGEVNVTLIILVVVFVFLPLNKSFSFISTLIYSSFFGNLLQMIYHSPRPFWIEEKIANGCNTAFGNPSGHSFTTFSIYFLLFHYSTDFESFKVNNKGIALKALILLLYLLLMVCVITSRIILGAHGINQIFYGSLLGIGLYFIIHHVMSYHTMTNEEFYNHLFNRYSLIAYPIIYFALITTTVLIYFFDQIDITEYKSIILRLCEHKKEYHILYNDNFFQTMSIFGLIGAHCGIMLLYIICTKKYSKKRALFINEWNSNSSKANFGMRLPILIISSSFIFLQFIQSEILWIRFIFKSAASLGLSLFGLFGIGLYICVIIGKCNNSIYNIDKVDEILEAKEEYVVDTL